MKTLLQEISDPKNFDAFIQEQMKTSTYKAEWKNEMETDYSASGTFDEFVGEYTAAQAGSIIAKNADKVLQPMPDLGRIAGSLSRIGDRWQLDNDRLDKLMFLEGRYRDRAGNFTAQRKASEWKKVLDFLFKPFEKAVIYPHKRVDLLFYNGLSDGKYVVNLANNPDGVHFEIDLKIPTYLLRPSDSLITDPANFDMFGIIQHFHQILRSKGKMITKIQATFNTVTKLLATDAVKGRFTVNVGTRGKANPPGIVSLEMVNEYLRISNLPPIEIVDVFVGIGEDTVVNAFKDDRLVFRTAASVAKLMIKDPLESKDPHPNKVYSVYDDNLVASYRTEEGRFVENEMNAIPVFNGKNDMAILKIDEKDS